METISYPKQTKARKEHRCNFCACRIPKGDTYVKSTHAYEGSIYDWKTHTHCSEIASRLKMYDHCDEGLTQDDFMETIHSEHDDILCSIIPDDQVQKFSDIIRQLRSVNFKAKLGYVIRHYKKIDKEAETSACS